LIIYKKEKCVFAKGRTGTHTCILGVKSLSTHFSLVRKEQVRIGIGRERERQNNNNAKKKYIDDNVGVM
jgi:peptidyl-tRNA hydrolase